MSDAPQLKLKNQICHRLYIASNGITRLYREPLEALNLTYPQYVVMLALWDQDLWQGKNISLHDLLQVTYIDAGAMTLILKKLQTKGFITIAPDPDDRRRKFIRLSAAGNTLKQQALTIPEKVRCQAAGFSDQEAQDLIRLLDKLNLSLN